MNKKKIGVIGCGNMAQMAHIPVLQSIEDVEIAALCDFREKVLMELGKKWGISNCVSSVEELLNLDIDAVYVLTPVQSHLANIKAALKAAKHVFTEKPAAMSSASVRELRKTAENCEKNITVGYMKQHEANIAELKKIQGESDWGKLLFVRTHSFIGSHWDAAVGDLIKPVSSEEIPPFDTSELDPGPAWLDIPRDKTFYSFDNPFYALLDTGCHSVNLIRHLTDAIPEVTGVRNTGGVRLVQFDFGGVPGTMEFCVNFAMHRWDEITELYYEKASIVIKTPPPLDRQTSAIVEIYTEDGALHRNLLLENNRQWAMRLQAEAFISKLKSDDSSSDLEEAEKDIEIIEEIYKQEKGIN